jgi:hypothetical protein
MLYRCYASLATITFLFVALPVSIRAPPVLWPFSSYHHLACLLGRPSFPLLDLAYNLYIRNPHPYFRVPPVTERNYSFFLSELCSLIASLLSSLSKQTPAGTASRAHQSFFWSTRRARKWCALSHVLCCIVMAQVEVAC